MIVVATTHRATSVETRGPDHAECFQCQRRTVNPPSRGTWPSHRRPVATPSNSRAGRSPPIAIEVGDLHLGVRPGNAALDACLRRAFPTPARTDLAPPPNYSIRLAEPVKHRRGAGFHMLYRSCGLTLRTRDPHRLVAGLVRHLDSHDPDFGAGLLAVSGVALVGEDRALIAPNALRSWMSRVERRLNLRGLRVVDLPWVLLDPEQHTIVVPDIRLAVDWAALEGTDGIDAIAPGSRPDPPVPTGRYPLTGWAFLGDGDAMSRAQAVASRRAPRCTPTAYSRRSTRWQR